jgi:diadenosine tetraphosphate (Ap4A) HIT family hydrolase
MENCIFCNFKGDDKGTVIFENDYCICVEQRDAVLVGSCMIIPKVHKETVFDLNSAEWQATRELMETTKKYLDTKYRPDGYNVGWNVGKIGGQEVFHAHLHIIPRYADEPFAGKGMRYWIKQKDNRRPSV